MLTPMTPNEAYTKVIDAIYEVDHRTRRGAPGDVVVVPTEALRTMMTALDGTAAALASLHDYWDRGEAALAR